MAFNGPEPLSIIQMGTWNKEGQYTCKTHRVITNNISTWAQSRDTWDFRGAMYCCDDTDDLNLGKII